MWGGAECSSPATVFAADHDARHSDSLPGSVRGPWLCVCRGPRANRVAASDAAAARAADGTTRDAEQSGRPALWRSVAAALQLSAAQRAEIAAAWQLLR